MESFRSSRTSLLTWTLYRDDAGIELTNPFIVRKCKLERIVHARIQKRMTQGFIKIENGKIARTFFYLI